MLEHNPCRDCKAPKRHAGCHGKCKEYLNWKVRYDNIMVAAKKKEYLEKDAIFEHYYNINKRRK